MTLAAALADAVQLVGATMLLVSLWMILVPAWALFATSLVVMAFGVLVERQERQERERAR